MRYFPGILMPSHTDPRPQSTRLRTRKMVALALVSLACSTTISLTGCNPTIRETRIYLEGFPRKAPSSEWRLASAVAWQQLPSR